MTAQARFHRDHVAIDGNSTTFARQVRQWWHCGLPFRSTCGSTVYWELVSAPDVIAVAGGNFADPRFPRPPGIPYTRSASTPRVSIEDDGSIERLD